MFQKISKKKNSWRFSEHLENSKRQLLFFAEKRSVASYFNPFLQRSLHENLTFPLKISLVNVNTSVENCGFVYIY